MKTLCFALCAFIGLAQARPVVLEEAATLSPPDESWEFFGRFGVAIDGDFALVSGERFVADPTAGVVHEGAALLYHHTAGGWSYAGMLGPISPITDRVKPGLAMKDGVAFTMIDSARVFERAGDSWTWVSYIDTDLQGPDVEVDQGRILVPVLGCTYGDIVAHGSGALWREEARLLGNGSTCGPHPPSAFGDIQGSRVAILNPDDVVPPVAKLYRLLPNGFESLGQLENNSVGNVLGPEIALSGPYVAVTGRRERGTSIAYLPDSGTGSWAYTGLQAVDSYLEPAVQSASAIERAGPAMFAQRNYSFDRKAYVINVFRVNDEPVIHSSTHLATLQTRAGTSVGSWIDTCGQQIIVSGRTSTGGDNTVRIYQLPASYETPAVQVHDFESPSSGAAWQPAAGNTFSVASTGTTHVYRQLWTGGDASSWLPASTARDQAIQAEVTMRTISPNGSDRWVGLLTRRNDASNYYYVTLRNSGFVQLKRRVDGVFTTLASAPTTVTLGRKYRLRLESIGTVHRVYLDDRLVLTARDDALTEGDAGVVMYRASADYDNVIVTPSPLTTLYTQDFSTADIDSWSRTWGVWQSSGGVLHQTSTGDYGRASIGTPTADQAVQARIRPVSFVAPGTWVGLMARYQDDRNYLYVSLVGRGVVSIWRKTNGLITQLATKSMTVTPGTWYDVRVEIVDGRTRVHVNNQLMLSTSADPGPTVSSGEAKGHVGLITYKAKADFDDFRAYQP